MYALIVRNEMSVYKNTTYECYIEFYMPCLYIFCLSVKKTGC